jgi:predicted nucleotidyltransferase
MNLKTFSRKGGKARSPAKTTANRAKASAYWAEVRAGSKPAPRRARVPPQGAEIASLLMGYCRRNGITRIESFGSVARGDARKGSDVDLIATFAGNPGLAFYSMQDEMATILGAPVHLLSRDSVENMTNPYRRESILADARVIYDGR